MLAIPRISLTAEANLEFYSVSSANTGSFSDCETGERIFVSVRGDEKHSCHTKGRNFPVLTSAFVCVCIPLL